MSDTISRISNHLCPISNRHLLCMRAATPMPSNAGDCPSLARQCIHVCSYRWHWLQHFIALNYQQLQHIWRHPNQPPRSRVKPWCDKLRLVSDASKARGCPAGDRTRVQTRTARRHKTSNSPSLAAPARPRRFHAGTRKNSQGGRVWGCPRPESLAILLDNRASPADALQRGIVR